MKAYTPSINIFFDTAKAGRAVTLAFEDKKGEIINLTVVISDTYTFYYEFGGKGFNRFSNNKREQYLMEVANAYLGIDEMGKLKGL